MDIRLGSIPTSTARIALTAPNPDGQPAGSQGQAWGFDAQTAQENPHHEKPFAWLADGVTDATPSDGAEFLNTAYEQYGRRGQVENPSSAPTSAPVQTFLLARPEGRQLDVRV